MCFDLRHGNPSAPSPLLQEQQIRTVTSSKCPTIVSCRTRGFSGTAVTPVTWLAHQDLWYPLFVLVIDGKREDGAPGEQSHAQ